MRHEDQERQDRLEHLYEIDGRHDPSHPLHSLYTGLWAAHTTTTTENDGSSVAGLDDRSSRGARDDHDRVPD